MDASRLRAGYPQRSQYHRREQSSGIAIGPDGNLWFTEMGTNKIGRMTTALTSYVEFTIPTTSSLAQGIAEGITVGPDGALWFCEDNASQIGCITTTGVITEFSIPTANSGPTFIVTGPDGNLWFTEYSANQIGRLVVP